MVSGTKITQRLIALGGEDQRQQADLERQVTADEPDPDDHRDQCHGDGGDQFQGQGGQERDLQRVNGCGSVLPGDIPEGPGLAAGPA